MDLVALKNKYLIIPADCITVRGATRSAIYDLTRKEIILISTLYFDLLTKIENLKVQEILNTINNSDKKNKIFEFLDYLIQYEIVIFVDDISQFPKLEMKWEHPSKIQNAIIDFDKKIHDFEKAIIELSLLGCQFIQFRFFSNLLDLRKINLLIKHCYNKSIEGIEVILKHDSKISDNDYIEFVEENPLISSLTIHSSVSNRMLTVDFKYKGESEIEIKREIQFINNKIESNLHCGVISQAYLNVPSVSNVMESMLYNGCLNRKIAIDIDGNIKNCPTMLESFGNIELTSLLSVYEDTTLKNKWNIKKDLINICKECEFRYVCSDCRALIEDPKDIYSKPLKCGYNPYTAEWSEWRTQVEKQNAISHYNLKVLE